MMDLPESAPPALWLTRLCLFEKTPDALCQSVVLIQLICSNNSGQRESRQPVNGSLR